MLCAGKPVIGQLASIIESRGMTATLLCRSDGHPSPTVTFRRLEPPTDTVYRSGQLYVSKAMVTYVGKKRIIFEKCSVLKKLQKCLSRFSSTLRGLKTGGGCI